jgi:hypothetical protein
MVPSLSHRKSRTGCRRCKARRVKCDEVHPICNNCKRHQVPCEYVPGPLKRDRDSAPIKSPHSTSPDDSNDLDDEDDQPIQESDERRLLELQLLHHYITEVTPTFPSSCYKEVVDVWTGYAVSLALHHSFLLNAILSLSTLHLMHTYPASSGTISANGLDLGQTSKLQRPNCVAGLKDPLEVHRRYLTLAARQQSEALQNASSENAPALFLVSVLLSLESLSIMRDRTTESGVYEPPIHWLRMVHGIHQMTRAIYPLLRTANVVDVFARYGGEPDFQDRVALFHPDLRVPFQGLLDFQRYPEPDLDSTGQSAYEDAVAYLGGIFLGLEQRESTRATGRRVITFGIMMPAKYIAFVEQRRPRALIILAYFCSMTIVLDGHWVFHGLARREVPGLQSLIPPEMQWLMEWPNEMVASGATRYPCTDDWALPLKSTNKT